MEADEENVELMEAYEEYFTYDQCYGIGLIGYYLLSAQQATVNVGIGDRGTQLAPGASTFNT